MTLLAPDPSYQERLARELRSRLAGISAATPDPADGTKAKYFHTVAEVLRVSELDVTLLDPELATNGKALYMLRPGDVFPALQTTGTVENRREFFVCAAVLWDVGDVHPRSGNVTQWELQEQLVHDIERAIDDDRSFKEGGVGPALAIRTDVAEQSFSIEMDGSTRWAVVIVSVTCAFKRGRGKP